MRARTTASLLALTLSAATVATAACGSSSATTATPVTTRTAASTPTAGSGLVPATDRTVSFVVDGTTTYGTLHVPAHRRGQSLAAALLLPGSGPTDRNGDESASFRPHTLSLLAGVLGTAGVMSLRFDKYASGQTGLGRYAADPGALDLQAFIRQDDAAYRLLAAQPEADRDRLLIVGHSEGGLTAMLTAESASPRPAGLALLVPQDQRLLDLVRIQLGEQLTAAVKAGQLSAAVARQNESLVNAAISAFRAGWPVSTTGMLSSIASLFTGALFSPANATFTRSDDATVPATVATRLAAGTRVLVTCGTADTNVPCGTLPPLLAGLRQARTTGPGLVTLTGVDHLLHPAGTPTNDAILAPSAVTALRSFLTQP
jgi:alpha-beta hydrolase superfamily lysophospholipase